jgi:uncharacterized protein
VLIGDEAKRAANIAKHGIDFTAAEHFAWKTAVITIDRRRDYGEIRETALGTIARRLHVLIFTRRDQDIRISSLRKANDREEKVYAEGQKA